MKADLFGTDGVRGTSNSWPMTAEVALRIGMAAGVHFANLDDHKTVIIGKDTRLSGYMLEPALVAGFTSVGMDVILVGPVPTPAIAMLTRSMRAALGVMISASHNPYYDNGIKLFGPDGYKLSDQVEHTIAGLVAAPDAIDLAPPAKIGRARRLDDAPGRYIEAVKQTFPDGLRLDGLKVVIDCANGAAYKLAPTILWELGAEIVSMGVTPDGHNINLDCGSVSADAMRQQVIASGAHIGISLDGDADRLVLADEYGKLIDGDQVMAAITDNWQARGRLAQDGIVATVMSNMGLERYLQDRNLTLHRTKVGDRHVVEAMRRLKYNLGGEQSGHIIFSDFATTGDGLVAALQVLALIVSHGRSANEIAHSFEPFPQILKSVRYNGASPLENADVQALIKHHQQVLADRGRVLVRKSGTEPLIRVMAEGEDEGQIDALVNEIIDSLETALAS